MKAILISIKPKWCELIASGKKTVEVRKTRPKIETPFKCYIYCTTDKRLLHKFDKGERIDDEHFFDEHVFVRQNTWIRGHLNPNQKVIGEFVCDRIYQYSTLQNTNGVDITDDEMTAASGLSKKQIHDYEFSSEARENCIYKIGVYGWHISDLVIYDEPKGIWEFCNPCDRDNQCDCNYCKRHGGNKPILRAPQSWCYVEEVKT